jgi:hypothetical protein
MHRRQFVGTCPAGAPGVAVASLPAILSAAEFSHATA